jgi:hypothetical protein
VLCCFFCTPPFCRFRVCYLDFDLSLILSVFFNNPFTLFHRYSVDYIWSTMEQWRQYLCRFLYTYDFLWSPHLSSITQTHINYRIYKPKARLVNWRKKRPNLFLFFKTIDLECAITFLLSLLERGWFCYCLISYD